MTERTIPRALRRRLLAEARGRCAYCRTPTSITGARLVIDHILPEASGGQSELGNLGLACHSCNEFKGARLRAEDPDTGKSVRLYHPRRDRWREHFCWSRDGITIMGLSAVGRATVAALNMNHANIVEARQRWAAVGWHPPLEDA